MWEPSNCDEDNDGAKSRGGRRATVCVLPLLKPLPPCVQRLVLYCARTCRACGRAALEEWKEGSMEKRSPHRACDLSPLCVFFFVTRDLVCTQLGLSGTVTIQATSRESVCTSVPVSATILGCLAVLGPPASGEGTLATGTSRLIASDHRKSVGHEVAECGVSNALHGRRSSAAHLGSTEDHHRFHETRLDPTRSPVPGLVLLTTSGRLWHLPRALYSARRGMRAAGRAGIHLQTSDRVKQEET